MAVRTSANGQSYTTAIGLGTQTQYSATCWLKITVDRNDYSPIWCVDSGVNTDEVNLIADTDGTTLIVLSEGSGQPTGVALTVGSWYFAGVAIDGSNGTMTVRKLGDASFTTQTWTFSSMGGSTNIANLRLGSTILASTGWLNGCICAMKLWSGAALTTNELQNEAWSVMPKRFANLVAWYPLLKPETPDYSGNGHTLTGGSGNSFEAGPAVSWGTRRSGVVIPLYNTYNLATADAATATDSLSGIRAPKRAFADSVAGAEALAGARVLARVGTEADGLTEITVITRGDSRAQGDAGSYIEVQVSSRGNSRSCGDPELVVEILARLLGVSRLSADSDNLAEFLSRSSLSTRSTTNSIVFLEISAGTRLISRVLADVLSSLEMLSKIVGGTRAITDASILGDYSTAIRTLARVFADIVSLTEFPTSTEILSRKVADAQVILEMVLRSYGVTSPIADALTTSDSPGSLLGVSRSFSDSCGFLDIIARFISLLGSLVDSLALFDSYIAKQELFRNPGDSLNTAKMLTYLFSPGRGVTDSLRATEFIAGFQNLFRGTTNLIAIIEENRRDVSALQIASNILGILDNCITASVVARVADDATFLLETPSASITLARNILETINLAEALLAQASYASIRSTADILNLVKALTQSVREYRGASDVLDVAKLLDAIIGLERDQLESVGFVGLLDQITSHWKGSAESFSLAEINEALTTIIRGQSDILNLAESMGIGRAVSSEDTLIAYDSGFGEAAIQRAFSDDFSLGELFLSSISQVWRGEEGFRLDDEETDSRYLTRALEDLINISEDVSTLAWYYQIADDLLVVIDAIDRAGTLVRSSEDAAVVDEEIESIRSTVKVIAEFITRFEQAASIRAVAKDGADILIVTDIPFTTLALNVTTLNVIGIADSLGHLLAVARALADNLHAWAWYGEGTKTLYRFPSETVHMWTWYEEGTKSLARFLDENIDLDEYYEEGVRYLSRAISESVGVVDLLSGFVSTIRSIGDLLHLWAWYEEGVRHLIRNPSEGLVIGEIAASGWPRVTFDILDLDEYYEEGVNHLFRATPDTLTLTPILFLGPIHIPSIYLYSSTMITDHGERTASVFRNVGGKTHLDQGP